MGEIKVSEINELKNSDSSAFKEIKTEGSHTLNDAKKFLLSKFDDGVSEIKKNINDAVDYIDKEIPNKTEYFSTEKERIDETPKDGVNGHWTGKRGNSTYIPSSETEFGVKGKKKLAEYGLKGLEYKNGEIDYSKCNEGKVEIDNMTAIRPCNFKQADEKIAKQWKKDNKDGKTDWTEKDVKKFRHDNGLSWHECCDRKTMMLVSQDIHGGDTSVFKHWGGVAECKKRDNIGGNFDE